MLYIVEIHVSYRSCTGDSLLVFMLIFQVNISLDRKLSSEDKRYLCIYWLLLSVLWLFSPRRSLVLWQTAKETGHRDMRGRPAEADLQAERRIYRSVERKWRHSNKNNIWKTHQQAVYQAPVLQNWFTCRLQMVPMIFTCKLQIYLWILQSSCMLKCVSFD